MLQAVILTLLVGEWLLATTPGKNYGISILRVCSLWFYLAVCLFVWVYGVSTFNSKFGLYVYTFNQGFLDNYKVGKIFYKQDLICLYMTYLAVNKLITDKTRISYQ